MASPIETCKLNDVNPLIYMSDLPTRLANSWLQIASTTHALALEDRARRLRP